MFLHPAARLAWLYPLQSREHDVVKVLFPNLYTYIAHVTELQIKLTQLNSFGMNSVVLILRSKRLS